MKNFLKKLSILTIIVASTLINTNSAFAFTTKNPVSDGVSAQWIGHLNGNLWFGSKYILVDETSCNSNFDYIYSSTYGNSIDFLLYSTTTHPYSPSTITNLKIHTCSTNYTYGISALYGVYYKNSNNQKIYRCFFSDNSIFYQAHTCDIGYVTDAEPHLTIGVTKFGSYGTKLSQIYATFDSMD